MKGNEIGKEEGGKERGGEGGEEEREEKEEGERGRKERCKGGTKVSTHPHIGLLHTWFTLLYHSKNTKINSLLPSPPLYVIVATYARSSCEQIVEIFHSGQNYCQQLLHN